MTNRTLAVLERSTWFAVAVPPLRRYCAEAGLVVPKVAVMSGTPVTPHALAEYWPATRSTDGLGRITVSATITDPVRALGVVVHELIHSGDNGQSGHSEWFAAWAGALGLTGPHWASPTPRLASRLKCIARTLPPWPPSNTGYSLTSDGRVVV